MKGKLKKFIVIALMAICVIACLSLGMANMRNISEDSAAEDAVVDSEPGIETYTFYNGDEEWDVECVDGRYLITAYYGTSKTPTVPYIEVNEDYRVTGIGESVFAESNITSITLNDDITYIGKKAFYKCTSLKTVSGANYVSYIGDSAFYYCESLTDVSSLIGRATHIGRCAFEYSGVTDVTIDYCTDVGEYVFGHCDSLKTVSITANITDMSTMFYCCENLTSVYYNAPSAKTTYVNAENFRDAGKSSGSLTITIGKNVQSIPAGLFSGYYYYYNGSSAVLEVCAYNYAKKITFEDGCACTSIGSGAFCGCCNVTGISIPSTVTSIGNCAFYECTSLQSFVVPDKVTKIGTSTFCNCTGLTSVTIPDSVTTIGEYAFDGCTALTSVTIPESVTSIGDYAFYHTSSLKDIYFNATNMTGNSTSTYGPFGYAGTSGLTLHVGANVTQIPQYMFYSKVTDYRSRLKTIEWAADCQASSIGSHAFYYCKSLELTEIPNSITSIGSYAFYYCTYLESVTIGENVSSIGVNAFYNCSSLASAKFEDLVGWYCSKCDFSTDDLSDAATAAKYLRSTYRSYEWCKKEADVLEYTLSSDGTYYILTKFNNKNNTYTDVVMDATYEALPVKEIASSVFEGHTEITSVIISENITTIDEYAFYNCTSLTSVTIPDSVTTIGEYAFDGCTGLTSLTIGEGVTTIGAYAFRCKYLTKINFNAVKMDDLSSKNQVFYNAGDSGSGIAVTIGANVTKIPAYLFFPYSTTLTTHTPSYTSVEFMSGSKCTSIGKYAFYSCSYLKSMEIPDSVTSIGNYAFYGCSGLTSLTIGTGVTSIGTYVFYKCSSLTSVTFKNTEGWSCSYGITTIDMDSSDLSNTSTAAKYLTSTYYTYTWTRTEGAGFTYRLSSDGSYYILDSYVGRSTNVTVEGTYNGLPVKEIGPYAFEGNTRMMTVVISENVTAIGEGAFYCCSLLMSVDFPSTLVTIGDFAFAGCTLLLAVEFPSGLVSIGEGAFLECACLMAVVFSSGLESIGEYAFAGTYLIQLYVDDLASFLAIDFADSYANPLSVLSENGGTFYVGGLETTKLTAINTAGVTRIGSYALAYCTIITDVALGEDVAYIGAHAFEGMSGLRSFTLSYYSGWTVYASSTLSSGTKIAAQDLQTDALEYFTSVYVAYTWKHTLTSTVAPVISSAVGNGDFTSVGFDVYVSVDSDSSIYCVYCVTPEGTVEYFYGVSSISVDSPVNGTYEIYAEDTEGTLSESYFIVFDDVAPELYLGGGAAWANYNSSEFSVLALDNLDSDVRLWYSLTGENGSWQLCDSNPFTISPNEAYSTDGRYWFVAVDAAGNVTGPYYTVLDAMPVEGYWEQGDDMFYYFRYEAPSYSEWTCTVNGAAYVSGTPFTTDCTTYDIVLTGANGTTYEISQYLDHYFPEEGEYHEATCTEQAYTTYTCIYCGSYYTVYDPYSSAGDHNYVLELVEPTCTESGHSQYVCTDCGATTGFSYIAPLGHDWSNSEVSIEPTCTTNGFIGQICQRCGAQNEYGEVIPATGHNFVNDEDFYTAPTCTEKGRSRNVCLNCHEMGDVTETPALGHLLITETLPATCTEYGYSKTYCTREGCDYETSTSSDGYLASHTWSDEPVERRDATCTEDGCLVYVCTVCGERDERTISAFGHSYEIVTDSAKWTFPGTITIDGTVYKVIDSYWNDGEAYVVVNRGGETDEVVPVWCKRCTVCGDTFLDYKTDAKETGNRVTEIFEKYQKYLWWILLALVVVWSLFIGLRWALQRNDQEKVKTRSMLANYVLGLFVIAVIIVGLPYLVYGIAILVG